MQPKHNAIIACVTAPSQSRLGKRARPDLSQTLMTPCLTLPNWIHEAPVSSISARVKNLSIPEAQPANRLVQKGGTGGAMARRRRWKAFGNRGLQEGRQAAEGILWLFVCSRGRAFQQVREHDDVLKALAHVHL